MEPLAAPLAPRARGARAVPDRLQTLTVTLDPSRLAVNAVAEELHRQAARLAHLRQLDVCIGFKLGDGPVAEAIEGGIEIEIQIQIARERLRPYLPKLRWNGA